MSISFKEYMSTITENQNDWGWFIDIEEPIIPKHKVNLKQSSIPKPIYNVKLENSIISLEQLEKRYYDDKEPSWTLNTSCIISLIIVAILIL